MKRLFFLSVIILTMLVSCSKDDNGNGKLDPNAMISLRPAPGVKSDSDPGHLTAKEIVEQTEYIGFRNIPHFGDDRPTTRGFADRQRDLVNNRLLMYGTDIIDQDGIYTDEFIEGTDFVFVRNLGTGLAPVLDTIAYISNATLRSAEAAIKSAYTKQDYEACYKIFDEAFTFIPITGAEWRALKAAGTN